MRPRTLLPLALAVLALVSSRGALAQQLYYVHTDHLNTPRLVADATGTTVWRWDQQEPFGANPADENPSGLGALDLPLRLPGQYYDKETNLHYNFFRSYDAGIGRYAQSDLIGLAGGLNTYAYAFSDPLHYFDSDGLEVEFICRPVLAWSHCFVHVTCPSKSIDVTLSLFGRFPYLRSTAYKSMATPQTYVQNPNYSDNPNSSNNTYGPIKITPQNNCDCAYEKSVIDKFNAAPDAQPYNAALNNSNVFAQDLVTSPQFGTALPPSVPRNAPGLFPSAVGRIR